MSIDGMRRAKFPYLKISTVYEVMDFEVKLFPVFGLLEVSFLPPGLKEKRLLGSCYTYIYKLNGENCNRTTRNNCHGPKYLSNNAS